METIKISWAHRIKKIFKWVFLVLVVLYIGAVVVRVFQLRELDKTKAEVTKIHATKLTLDDVMGKNLPPDPGSLADQTVQGIDANNNGIRDDVELAVFKAYPNSAKTRAVLLQYALALQMETTQPTLNTEIVTEVVREQSRAYACVGEILIRDDNNKQTMDKYFSDGEKLRLFVKQKQFNTQERMNQRNSFLKNLGSYSELNGCDIDYLKLLN